MSTRTRSAAGRLFALAALLPLGAAPALATDDNVAKPSASAASPVTAAMADMQKTLSGMGYSIDRSESDWFSFDAGTYHVTTDFSSDATRAYFEVRYDLPGDKLTKMPGAKALEWNGSHADYFGFIKYGDGTASWMLECSVPTASATPKILRNVIDNLVHDAVTQQALLDPSTW